MSQVSFTEVSPSEAERYHISDAIRAMKPPTLRGVSVPLFKLTLLVLLSHMNADAKNVYAYDGLSMPQLAHEVGTSVRHIRRVRSEIERVGPLTTIHTSWCVNTFRLDTEAILRAGKHGKAHMDSARALKRSQQATIVRDAASHADIEYADRVLAGAEPGTYTKQEWRGATPGQIYRLAFREWPQLAAVNRRGSRIWNALDRPSLSEWSRQCDSVAELLRDGTSDVADRTLFADRYKAEDKAWRAISITSQAGWGLLVAAAEARTAIVAHTPMTPDVPEHVSVDVGPSCPLPQGALAILWRDACDALQVAHSDRVFREVWLDKGQADRVEDGRLVVVFPTAFYVQHLTSADVDWTAVDIPIRLTGTS